MIQDGANINVQTFVGETPLLLAIKAAISESLTHTVGELINQGANTELGNERGVTPLMMAAYNGRVEIVRWLINIGTSKTSKWNGKTAHTIAMECGYTKVAELIEGPWYEIERERREKRVESKEEREYKEEKALMNYFRFKKFPW